MKSILNIIKCTEEKPIQTHIRSDHILKLGGFYKTLYISEPETSNYYKRLTE